MPEKCRHYDDTARDNTLRNEWPARLGFYRIVAVDERQRVERRDVFICPVCAEELEHWLAVRTATSGAGDAET